MRRGTLALALAAALAAACPALCGTYGECDPIGSGPCYTPFPSDFYRDSATGRLNLTGAAPANRHGDAPDAETGGWNSLDGFPAVVSALAYLPNASLAHTPGAARVWNTAASLDAACPTVLLDTVTGERVAHWTELDHRSDATHPTGYDRLLMMWPAAALQFGRRYVWAVRGVMTADAGAGPVAASPAFAALRDNTSSPDPSVNARRARFDKEVFAPLEAAGVVRGGLQLAWDFTVASQDDTQGRLLFMRDDALARVRAAGGVKYEVTSVTDDYSDDVFREINGSLSVPCYLATPLPFPDSRLVLNSSGSPVFQSFANANFSVIVPRSCVGAAGAGAGNCSLQAYGHGLFGSRMEIEAGWLQAEANAQGRVVVAVDEWGLAEDDVPNVVLMLLTNLTNFGIVPDRLQQGVVNAHLALEMVVNGLSGDPALRPGGRSVFPAAVPVPVSYAGNSQGGIEGSVYLATSLAVARGSLGVPGGPYSLLLPRSKDFVVLWALLDLLVYPDPSDKIFVLAFFQCLWARGGPGGWFMSAGASPPARTPPHVPLIQFGEGDAQVTYLGALTMARSCGAVTFESEIQFSNHTLYGLPRVPDDANVTAAVAVGFGFTNTLPLPNENVPPSSLTDTHECPRRAVPAQAMQASLFDRGFVYNACGGPCANLTCTKRADAPPAGLPPRWWVAAGNAALEVAGDEGVADALDASYRSYGP